MGCVIGFTGHETEDVNQPDCLVNRELLTKLMLNHIRNLSNAE